MYAITDEETGRYLSRRSVTVDTNGGALYVTYNGKLGTEFFQSLYEAEITLNILLKRIHAYGAMKFLQIIMVDPDAMILGQQFVELLEMSKKFAMI